jgi:hypothetical protein
MARLEREEKGSLAAAVGWYERLDAGAEEARWVCHACNQPSPWWREICSECGAFAQMEGPQAGPAGEQDQARRLNPVSLPGIGTSRRLPASFNASDAAGA